MQLKILNSICFSKTNTSVSILPTHPGSMHIVNNYLSSKTLINQNIKAMKKLNLFILSVSIVIMTIGCTSKSEVENDLDGYGLKGKVKEAKYNYYDAIEKFGEVAKGDLLEKFGSDKNATLLFNEDGYLIEETEYHVDGSIYLRTIYELDDTNRCIKVNYYNNEGKLVFYEAPEFNEKGNKERTIIYLDDQPILTYKMKYDLNGNRIEKTKYGKEGNIKERKEYTYDGNKNLIEIQEYDSSGAIVETTKYKYNEKGNQTEKEEFDEEGNLSNKVLFYYNDKDLDSKREIFEPDGSLDFTATYEYKFDNEDNWTAKIIRFDGEPVLYLERSIIYYPE